MTVGIVTGELACCGARDWISWLSFLTVAPGVLPVSVGSATCGSRCKQCKRLPITYITTSNHLLLVIIFSAMSISAQDTTEYIVAITK